MSDEVATSELIAVRPNGERLAVRIAVFRPLQTEHGDWSCHIAAEPLFKGGVIGQDSLQALALALSFGRQMLGYFLADGGRLLGPDQEREEDYPIDAAFGSAIGTPEQASADTSGRTKARNDSRLDDGVRDNVGIVISAVDRGAGRTRVIFDDFVGDDSAGSTQWRSAGLFTWHEYDERALGDLSLSEKDFAEIGFAVVVRLQARRKRLT